MGVGKNTYYSDALYERMLAVAKKEYPDGDGVNKVIQTGVALYVRQLEEKHGLVQGGEKHG